ncbi:MAG: pentapeptide repeat-containing protein [Cyanobacteria bacterium P01_D01_bin.105]
MRFPEWTGFQEKKLWDWLDLLLVPLMLAAGIFVLESAESRRQEYNLAEQYKQQILRDYFNELNAIVFDQQKFDALKNSKIYAPERELLGSRTLAALEVLEGDEKRKSQIIRFIGNSSLSPLIPIRRANLANLDLSYVDLYKADMRRVSLAGTSLIGANLKGAYLCDADLSNADFTGANLDNAKYSNDTVIPEGIFSESQLQSMDRRIKEQCEPALP